MQLVKHTILLALRDDEDIENFIEKLEMHIGDFLPKTIYNISSLMEQEIKHIDYPDSDLSSFDEVSDWTKKSTEFIDKEFEGDELNDK